MEILLNYYRDLFYFDQFKKTKSKSVLLGGEFILDIIDPFSVEHRDKYPFIDIRFKEKYTFLKAKDKITSNRLLKSFGKEVAILFTLKYLDPKPLIKSVTFKNNTYNF